MKHNVYQIAIDGPGGAGKSTIAQEVARRLNFLFINTGGMYRCYALALLENHVDINNLKAVEHTLNTNIVSLQSEKLFLNNQDVTARVYTGEIAALASKIGTIGLVRTKCVADQQKIAMGQSCVMEGRDTTTVVLPNATLKIYLTASLEIRAERR
jgi:cytidylate kinase